MDGATGLSVPTPVRSLHAPSILALCGLAFGCAHPVTRGPPAVSGSPAALPALPPRPAFEWEPATEPLAASSSLEAEAKKTIHAEVYSVAAKPTLAQAGVDTVRLAAHDFLYGSPAGTAAQ